MREIKFRVWNGIIKRYECYAPLRTLLHSKDGKLTLVQNENITLEQYTGLKDKNGVEIYEGDRMAYHPFYVTVYWNNKITGYYMKFDYDKKDMPLNYRLEDFEIIGNIHKE